MTFTIRDGKTTCDHCGLRVGKGWRSKRDHECPRPQVTIALARTCEHCTHPLVRKETESATNYRRRRFCDNSCSSKHTNRRRAAA